MTFSFRSLLVVLAGALLLTGCRTYGDEGYESGPKMYSALQETVQQLEQDLGRAESNLRRLESAAQSADDLQPLTERYRTLVQGHEATLQQYREQAEQLSTSSAYRSLHRSYGALITDRRLIQRQYERTTRNVWAAVRDSTVPRAPIQRKSSYMTTPVQYPEGNQLDISMGEALRGVEDTPGLQREE